MILKYFLVFWFALGMVMNVGMVGKPRKPIEPAAAAITSIISLGLIAAIFVWWPS